MGAIAGGGVRYSEAEAAIADFAKRHGVPVAETILDSLGAIDLKLSPDELAAIDDETADTTQ